jgi:hypothetical protein
MNLPVSGPYSNVVNFIRDLEESETFFIINSINVHGGSQPGTPEVTMALSSETFFYQ